MAEYYTIRCPHCKGINESGRNRVEQYGSPFRPCRHCGKVYIDNNYVEAGLFDEEDLKSRAFSWKSIALILVGGFMLYFGISELNTVLIITSVVTAGIGIASIIFNRNYNPSSDESLQRELQASKERLSDPKYVIALWKAGCKVTPEIVEWAKKETNYKKENHGVEE